MHYADAPEVYVSKSLELVRDIHGSPPQVVSPCSPETIRFPPLGDLSNAPEPLPSPRDTPPEVALDQAPEVRSDGDPANEKVLAAEYKLNDRIRRTGRRWAALIGVVVVCAAIGGSIGGVFGHRSRSVEYPK